MNAPEIEKIFESLRKAGHGSIIKLDVSESGHPVEGIIFKPGSQQRPSGYESGIFITVPSEVDKIYYLNPEASKQEGRLVIEHLEVPQEKRPQQQNPEDLLKEFEHVRQAPDVKRGGGCAGEANSKAKGIVDLG